RLARARRARARDPAGRRFRAQRLLPRRGSRRAARGRVRASGEYAVRLAASPGLLDEERLKVVSLCDELCALEELGLPFPNRGSFVAEMTEHLSKARGRYEPFARADALRDTFWHRQLLRSSTATK